MATASSARVSLAALALLALGCSRASAPPQPPPIVRLLDFLDVESRDASATEIRKVLLIDAAAAAREGRLAPERGIEGFEPTSDGVAFRTAQRKAALALDIDLEATTANMVALTVDSGGSRLVQGRIRWYREGEDTPPLERSALLRPPLGLEAAQSASESGAPQGADRFETLYAYVGQSEDWSGRIRRLLVEPTIHPGIDIRIRSIDFLEVPYLVIRQMLEGEGATGPFQIARETREGIFAAPPFRATAHARVPAQGVLEVGFGIVDSQWKMPGDGVRFRVFAEAQGEAPVLLVDRYVDPKHRPEDRAWIDERVYLPAFARRDVRFTFETLPSPDGTEPDPRFDAAVISGPRVYVPGLDRGERNVILVSLDTVRADRLGLYGNPRPATPNLDRLARESAVFREATSQAPRTLDSHMSIFTSLYPSTHNMVTADCRLNPEFRTVTEVLRDRGYHSAAFTESGFVSAKYGFSRGFDAYREGKLEPGKGGDVVRTFDGAIDWLRSNGEKKFFLFVHTYEAHVPYCPDPPYRDMFAEGYDGRLEGRCVTRKLVERYNAAGERPSQDDLDYMIAKYDEELRFLDAHVGRLLRTVEELGLRERTLVVLLSDHGEEFLEHLLFGKHAHAIWQPILHVPLLVRAPGDGIGGVRVEGPVALVDTAPTILDLLGIPIPEPFQGTSLLPRLRGEVPEAEEGARPLFSENHGFVVRASLRRGGYKYIRTYEITEGKEKALEFYPGQEARLTPYGDRELYDLRTDPQERRNLVEGLPDLAASFDRETQAMRDAAIRVSKPAVAAGVDADMLDKLRDLGYIGDEEENDAGETPRKPKK